MCDIVLRVIFCYVWYGVMFDIVLCVILCYVWCCVMCDIVLCVILCYVSVMWMDGFNIIPNKTKYLRDDSVNLIERYVST
jgi:hypothetical protein